MSSSDEIIRVRNAYEKKRLRIGLIAGLAAFCLTAIYGWITFFGIPGVYTANTDSNLFPLHVMIFGIGIIFFPIFAFPIAIRRMDFQLLQAARTWPTAPGVVESVEVSHHSNQEVQFFEPKIRYSFAVSGRTFLGDTLKIGRTVGYTAAAVHSQEEAVAKLLPFVPGTSIMVAYDPADASNNALHPVEFSYTGYTTASIVGLIIALTLPFTISLILWWIITGGGL